MIRTVSPPFDTLQEWLAWQETLHPRAIDPGLERIAAVAGRMQLLTPEYAVVTVAGTNGKGSCVAFLESILLCAGYRVGAYTSPHLLRYNERVRIEGGEAGNAALCNAFQRINEARDGISLTYFEFSTLAALYLFRQERVDIALLEVGLGGRLDAVNVVDPDVALLAGIDLDHTDWLGESREQIGWEKAGIMRAGKAAVCGDPGPPQSVSKHAVEIGARLFRAGPDFKAVRDGEKWNWEGPETRYTDLPLPALQGVHQLRNAAAVIMALELLADRYPVARECLLAGLSRTSLPGRFQIIPGDVELILDVAHNVQAAATLAETLGTRPCAGRTSIVLGMLADKDIDGFVEALAPQADCWHFASLPVERGLDAAALVGQTGRCVSWPVKCHESVYLAYLDAMQDARAGDRIVVCGSFHTVAELLMMKDNQEDPDNGWNKN